MKKKNQLAGAFLVIALLLVGCSEKKGMEAEPKVIYNEIKETEEHEELYIFAAGFGHLNGYVFIEEANELVLSTGSLMDRYVIQKITVKNKQATIEVKRTSTFEETTSWGNVSAYTVDASVKGIDRVVFEGKALPPLAEKEE